MIPKKSLTTFTLLLVLSSLTFGQGEVTRDLLDSLAGLPQDSAVMRLRYRIAVDHFYSDASLARSQGRAALTIALDQDIDWHISELYILLGWAYLENAQWDSCTYYTNQLIQYAPSTERIGVKGEAYRIQAVMFSQKGDFGKSIEMNELALKDAIENGQKDKEAATLNNIAMQFYNQEDTATALKYFRLAKSTYLSVDGGEQNLANVLKNMASLHRNLDSSIILINSALEIYSLRNQTDLIGSAYAAKSDTYFEHQMADSCVTYAKKAFEILSASSTSDYYEGFRVMSRAHQIRGNYGPALAMIDSALLGYENQASPEVVNDLYRRKALLLEQVGDYKLANLTLNKSLLLSDSLSRASNKEITQRFNVLFETEKKDHALRMGEDQLLRSEQKRKNIILGSIFFFLLIGGFTYWYFLHQKKKNQIKDKEMELARREKQAVEELSELRTQFFTNISHELKTPLTLISGPLDELNVNALSDQDREYLLLAKKSSQQLLSLMNEILQLAKLESNDVPVNPKPLLINAFLRRTLTSQDSFAKSRQVILRYESNLSDEVVDVDEGHLERILSNLISNAIKYTREDSEVCLKVFGEEQDKNLHLSIDLVDQGEGIPLEQQEHIFERFYQSNSIKGSEMGGVGIGLSLATQLAKHLGGQLQLKKSSSKGSTFSLDLNLALNQMPEKVEAVDFVYQSSLDGRRERTILIVEDNQDMLDYLVKILGPYFNLVLAKDGVDALQKIQTQPEIDLITSDIMMPKLDGFGLKERLLQLPNFKHLPFLFLTARSLDEDIIRGFHLGADDYVLKPFKSAELLARIQNLLINNDERRKFAESVGPIPEKEKSVVQKFEDAVRGNLNDSSIKLGDISTAIGLSERQLRRIIKRETGLTPTELILELRLIKSRYLLEQKKFMTVAEVMYEVGIESASYFSKKYTQRFGIHPSEVLKR